jgi:hypothetical protein
MRPKDGVGEYEKRFVRLGGSIVVGRQFAAR